MRATPSHPHATIRPHGGLSILGAALFMLSGCVGVAVESVRGANAEYVHAKYIDAAKAGDAEAQFKIGESYCCSVDEESGFYNTKTSVEWLCKSARQGHVPAMNKLGKIYSGDVVDGARILKRAAHGVAGVHEDHAIALVWSQFAALNGDADAKKRVDELWKQMSVEQKNAANAYIAMGYSAPCEWSK